MKALLLISVRENKHLLHTVTIYKHLLHTVTMYKHLLHAVTMCIHLLHSVSCILSNRQTAQNEIQTTLGFMNRISCD